MSGLAGKHYWLIGASAGIGRHLALRLAREGVVVTVSARDTGALQRLLAEMAPVQAAGGGHSALSLDVTDRAGIAQAGQNMSAVDGLIYCAGAYEPMSACRPDVETLETMVDVNLMGAMRILATCVPAFCQRGSGHIVLVGSLAGYRGLPNAWGYGATKAALIHLAENLRCDLRSSGILVQVCNPGFVETRLTDKNQFHMPFIISAQSAAECIMRGMARGRFEIAFPIAMAIAMKLLAALPAPLYFRLSGLANKQPDSA